jgi:hypothetical protein
MKSSPLNVKTVKGLLPVAALASLLFGAACTTAPAITRPVIEFTEPAPEPLRKEAVFNGNINAVWPKIVAVISQDYAVAVIERTSGNITTQPSRLTREQMLEYTVEGKRSVAADPSVRAEEERIKREMELKYKAGWSDVLNAATGGGAVNPNERAKKAEQDRLDEQFREQLKVKRVRPMRDWGPGQVRYVQVLAQESGSNRVRVAVRCDFGDYESSGQLEYTILNLIEAALK